MKFHITILALFLSFSLFSQKKTDKKTDKNKFESAYKEGSISGLSFRSIGPALTSGRIGDLAVNPQKPHEFYVAVASGNVFKTTNHGTTFTPIFDNQGSYSIGCITLAPSNSSVVWIGTGENNNQRSAAYGDGVYKSTDAGKTWKNMGLKNSEHIGMIWIDPTDENTVFVAAYGPLWSAGGDRGIYKTTDGGENWGKVLNVSENTGFNEIHADPRNSDVMYATAHQRRRHVWTYIDGGPESAIYKTIDGGENWKKLEGGLPSGEIGRIGMDISPANPDVVYAIISATETGGFFRSEDRGESWTKMSDHQTSGNYYQEIYCDLEDVNTVYSMDTWLHHTEDGGKTFQMTGEKSKHVDNHAMWIDPTNTDHWLVGCDGGLYETWNAAEDWKYYDNLPITQFYKVALDNAEPFYNVYGGTQDNNTQGGPSRTSSEHGILNSDWFITNGGDGFQPRVDPTDPNIVYGQAQYGWLVRYDKASGERVPIQPQPGKDEDALRWNWDSPLIISPHNHKRLYFAANKVFRSDNRGDSWTLISDDLTRKIDRNSLKVMGRVWSPEAVMKNQSTSIYGNIVALDESPVQEGLLYAGTDDGLIQTSTNGGESWTKQSGFPGIPDRTYVNMIKASKHDANTVYAVFNNHKNGDFKPYILKSINGGGSWSSISTNLPERGSVYAIAEDHVNKDLLFAGTEFGAYFSNDGGNKWTELGAGLPTIAVRDLAIQERENDLVLATFGRSFYVLDDYSPLRSLSKDLLANEAHIFPVKDALLYVESNKVGGSGKGHMGESFFTAENPPFGAIFTYSIGDTLTTKKEIRVKRDKAAAEDGLDSPYPSLEELREEDREEKPYLLFVIKDSNGKAIRKIKKDPKVGINRVSWNLRHTATSPIKLVEKEQGRYSSPDEGMLALPGTYTVTLFKNENGVFAQMAEPVSFEVVPLNNQSIPAESKEKVLAFQEGVAELQRSMEGTQKLFSESEEKVNYIKKAIELFPTVPLDLSTKVKSLEDDLYAIKQKLYGDATRSSREFETLPGLTGRLEYVAYSTWWNTSNPTQTARDQFDLANNEYQDVLAKMKSVAAEIAKVETELTELKVPYTPGRGEGWRKD
ncbi:glycosyl hydrolase [Cryomorpha ignava]|uniref:Glycosyl hydrolase n=1 Tax=Cryomorpha ignava TaxID=101383 RepID=A0A7K3WSQ4_9FLAO|nr:glycosyl hydrolase [Cryomorpha ignava]NEN24723.1 glycosyl hydrolase [Cryomorpha ignava]